MSIGIPVFNGERFIAAALTSLLAQDYTDFQAAISDNGSTDGTTDICRGFVARDARLQYVRHEANRGAAWNFNAALRLTSGPYFKWMAADDEWDRDVLGRCVGALDSDPSAVLAWPRGDFIGQTGNLICTTRDFIRGDELQGGTGARTRRVIRAVMRDGRAAMSVVFGLCRRPALERAGPLGNYYAADCVLISRLALQGSFTEVDGGARYRLHEGSSSGGRRTFDVMYQQRFMDPAVRGRLLSEIQYRRRYIELMRAVASAPLPYPGRVALGGTAVVACGRHLVTHEPKLAAVRSLSAARRLRGPPGGG